MKERKISDNIQKFLRVAQQQGLACWGKKMHGSAMSGKGMTDWVIIIFGDTYYVEVKTLEGKVTDIQAATHEKIRKAHGVVVVFYGWDHAHQWLKEQLEYYSLDSKSRRVFEEGVK